MRFDLPRLHGLASKTRGQHDERLQVRLWVFLRGRERRAFSRPLIGWRPDTPLLRIAALIAKPSFSSHVLHTDLDKIRFTQEACA
jgi:hypothetical protein